MNIKISPFGSYRKQAVFKYVFTTAKGAGCAITNLGGAIISVRVPDKKGAVDNVVLGCTHYAFAARQMCNVVGDVLLVDGALGTALQLK